MSYLELEDGIPDFDQAVISLWFRVPKQTLIDVANDQIAENNKRSALEGDANAFYVFPRLMGVVPLLVFGPLADGYQIKAEGAEPESWTETVVTFSGCAYHTTSTNTHNEPATTSTYTQPAAYLSNPSFIGLKVAWTDDDNVNDTVSASLNVRLQMPDNGSGSGISRNLKIHSSDWTSLSSVSWDAGDGCEPPPTDTAWNELFDECQTSSVYPDGTWNRTATHSDVTELFSQAHGPEAFEAGSGLTVEPDHWHHALISFDLKSEVDMKGEGTKQLFTYPDCPDVEVIDGVRQRTTVSSEVIHAVTNPCRMWIALDDINREGDSIFANGAGVGLGTNGIATENVYNAATASNAAILHNKFWASGGLVQIETTADDFTIPTYTYTPKKLPSNNNPLGVPCTKALQACNRHVEMGELQIFTGVVLDTKQQDNRRAFINDKGKPVSPVKAEKLLKKKPVILLNKAGNWIKGNNTGADVGDGLPAVDFEPTGTIKRYRPNPSLHGPQKPGDKKAP